MKYAICMIVHDKPKLLERIVSRLNHSNTEILIHLDARCKLTDYNFIKNVTFITKRVKVDWGGRSMVKAMYNLIDYAINKTECEYIIFISGQDFPIIIPKDYNKYIDINKNYIEYSKLPKIDWHQGGIDRVRYYYLFRSSKKFLSRLSVKLQKQLNINKRIDQLKFTIYGGSQWIQINRNVAKYIIEKWNYYYRFFKFCNIPDELIFQTIVLNSEYKDTVINNNYRFLRYQKDCSHADYVDASDANEIYSGKYLFCRKIKDEIIFDQIETINKVFS